MTHHLLKTRTLLVAVALLTMPLKAARVAVNRFRGGTRGSASRCYSLGIALVLTSALLAGCIGGDGGTEGQTLGYASFDDAANAQGKVLEAVNTDSDIQMKLLQPADPTSVPTGDLPVVLLLYDAGANEPITDADVAIEAMMPAMGHGTSGEEDPTHAGMGIYEGKTVLSMPGTWIINLDVTLADGTPLEFDVEVQGGGDGSMDGSMDHGNMTEDTGPRTFESFAEAREATGTTLEAESVTAPVLTERVEDGFTNALYMEQVPFHVADRPVDTLILEGALEATLPAGAEINATILDPSGEAVDTLVITSQEPTGSLTLDSLPGAGEYVLNVTGHAVNASYALDLTVIYEPLDLTVKLLDPEDPTAATTGKSHLVVLLTDEATGAPVTNADIELTSWMPMMGHGTSGEKDPMHDAHGQYVGISNWKMMGSWLANLTVTLPLGDVLTYEVPIEVTEEGSGDASVEMEHDHGGDGHDHGHGHGGHDH